MKTGREGERGRRDTQRERERERETGGRKSFDILYSFVYSVFFWNVFFFFLPGVLGECSRTPQPSVASGDCDISIRMLRREYSNPSMTSHLTGLINPCSPARTRQRKQEHAKRAFPKRTLVTAALLPRDFTRLRPFPTAPRAACGSPEEASRQRHPQRLVCRRGYLHIHGLLGGGGAVCKSVNSVVYFFVRYCSLFAMSMYVR